LVSLALLGIPSQAAAVRYETLHGFSEGPIAPSAAVIQASDGMIYGVTEQGGGNGHGTVFRMLPDGLAFTTLVQFTKDGTTNAGKAPVAELLEWSDGTHRYFYGTTNQGGAYGLGTVFRMTPDGALETLIHFTGISGANRGSNPQGTLILAADGGIYGTTHLGGDHDQGTIFRMTPAGALMTLFHFDSANAASSGAFPSAGLIESLSLGSFYGNTSGGGATGHGTVFKYTPGGDMVTLVEFTGETGPVMGDGPAAPLTRASDGNYYGTTKFGSTYGGYDDQGTIFKMTPSGTFTLLAAFIFPAVGEHRGMWPQGALVEGDDGNLYGTTYRGGWSDYGTVFRISKSGGLTTLVDFNHDLIPLGTAPSCRLIKLAGGDFLGTTSAGGTGMQGTVFRMTPTGTLTTLVDLSGRGRNNQGGPATPSGVTPGSDGYFYVATNGGGTYNKGTITRCAADGSSTVLVSFTGNLASNKGSEPTGSLVESGGNFYGVTYQGGASDKGTIFRMTPAGVITTLVEFTGTAGGFPGENPQSGLLDGGDGFLYGITQYGGASSYGTIFKVTTAGAFTSMVQFTGSSGGYLGANPLGKLVKATDGKLYGTTLNGGTSGDWTGTAFSLTMGGTFTSLYSFDSFAAHPQGLMQASDGNFYGVTRGTGFPYPGYPGGKFAGDIFKLTSAGAFMTIATFYGDPTTAGRYPGGRLIEGSDGMLYGTMSDGGESGMGILFRTTMSGAWSTLVNFTGTSGEAPGNRPTAELVSGPDGSIYGVTADGGVDANGKPAGLGELFRLRFWDYRNDHPIWVPVTEAALPGSASQVWSDAAAGTFDGLLRYAGDGTTLVGSLSSLVVTRAVVGSGMGGSVTGKVIMNGKTATITGKFTLAGVLAASLPQTDGSTVVLNLQLMRTIAHGGDVLRGTITWNSATANVDAPRAPYSTVNPAPPTVVGTYTMLLPSQPGWSVAEPGGDGWATVKVSTAGVVTISGKLGDGVALTETCYVSLENEACIYTDLYASTPIRGRFGGKIVFRNNDGISDFDGLMQWKKFADAREAYYKAGFAKEVWAIGSRYYAPATGVRVLSQLADQEYNATLNLMDESLLNDNGQFSKAVSWLTTNVIKYYGTQTLSTTFTAASGALTGSYLDALLALNVKFTGIAFQKQGIAAGSALFTTTVGAVRIQPGTNLLYPGSENAGVAALTKLPGSSATPPATVSQAWLPALVGTYNGVLTKDGSTRGGIQSLIVAANRTFTASLWVDGRRYALKGTFALDGLCTTQVLRTGTTPIDVTLHLASATGFTGVYQLTGLVTKDGETFGVDAQQLPVYTTSNRAAQEGKYTMAITPNGGDITLEPGGEGYGSLVVSYTGVCSGAVTLADGTAFTNSGHLSKAGEWSMYRGLYGTTPNGYLVGKLTFRSQAGISDCDGEWHWVKNPGAAPTTVYPAGFDTVRVVVGARYTPPITGVRAWAELAYDTSNVWLRLDGPDISKLAVLTVRQFDRTITWTTANKLTYYGPEKIVLTFNASTGLISGSITDSANGISQNLGGALLQNQSLVVGFYRAGGQSGRVVMEAR